MHLPALLTTPLLAAALLAGAPPAHALAPSPTPSASPSAPEPDPCAPVDGEPPPMCQSGLPADDGALPRTGRDDLPALAAGGSAALALGAWLVVAARRRTA